MRITSGSAAGTGLRKLTLVFGATLSVPSLALLSLARFAHERGTVIGVSVVFLVIGLILLFQGLWEAWGKQVWWVGPDFLKLEQSLFGCKRVQVYRKATLKLVHGSNADYPPELRVQGGPPSPSSWWGLVVVEAGKTRCLHSLSRLPEGARSRGGKEELCALGELLSGQTGWPLLIDRRRPQ